MLNKVFLIFTLLFCPPSFAGLTAAKRFLSITANATVTTCGTGSKCVFVTSTQYTGNLGGVSGANTKCGTRATAAGLAGTFKAWIAVTTGTDDPATTFTQSSVAYRLVDGTLIANNWSDLIDGSIANTVSKDEFGAAVTDPVWTNVATNGTAYYSGSTNTQNCTGWGSANSGRYGQTGSVTITNSSWTATGSANSCNTSTYRIMCFQQ